MFTWVQNQLSLRFVFFFQAEDGIRDYKVTGVQTCALPISVRLRHRAEVHGNVRGLRDHLPVGVEQRRGAIAPLADVRRHGGVDQHQAHLLRDRREGVPHHLETDGVETHRRSATTAPERCTVPRHPGSSSAVASRPARIAGPSIVTSAASSSSAHTDAATRSPPAPPRVIERCAPQPRAAPFAPWKPGTGPSRSATTRRLTTSTGCPTPECP